MTETERLQASNPVVKADILAENTEIEIDVIELLYQLIDRWKFIVCGALIGTIIAAFWTLVIITPKYQATSKLYVLNSNDSAINLSDLQIGAYLTSDYQEVFKTWELHEMVIENLNLPYEYGVIQGMLSLSNPSGTRVLYITVTSDNPQEAAAIANEYATVASKYISETMSTVQPNKLSVALVPTKPISPNKTLNIMLGFIVGAMLTVAVVTILFIIDDKVKTADEIQKYIGLPNLAIVPLIGSDDRSAAGKQRRKA